MSKTILISTLILGTSLSLAHAKQCPAGTTDNPFVFVEITGDNREAICNYGPKNEQGDYLGLLVGTGCNFNNGSNQSFTCDQYLIP